MPSLTSTASGSSNLVQAFRGNPRESRSIHPLETALVVLAGLHLTFLPWCIGARMPWAQVVSLILGFSALILSLWPRREVDERKNGQTVRLRFWPRLLRFPLFWLGLIFFAYVATQALNPAWRWVSASQVWYLERLNPIEWLPSGVDAPFERMNAWRMLCIWGGAWSLACALWIGFTRRASVVRLLNLLVIGGTLIALIAILQKLTGTMKFLWIFDLQPHVSHATFVYKNHAAAYLNLIFAISVALAAWHHARGVRKLERSTPAPVYGFAAVIIGAAVFMSGSRAAMLLLGAYIAGGLITYLIWRSRARDASGNWLTSALGGAAIIIFIALTTYFLNLDKSVEQIRNAFTTGRYGTIEFRVMARDATLDLVKDQPLTGWGAGSFRHVFPFKQQAYPEIYRAGGQVFFWDHAHNDHVQALAELGILGMLAPMLGLGWLLIRLLRAGAPSQPAFVLLLIGLGLTLAHAWVDFPLYNPAILTTFVALWILLVRWADLERSRR